MSHSEHADRAVSSRTGFHHPHDQNVGYNRRVQAVFEIALPNDIPHRQFPSAGLHSDYV
jgi:hypothetical protein